MKLSSVAMGNQWNLNGATLVDSKDETIVPAAAAEYILRACVNDYWSPYSSPLNYVITSLNSPELERAIRIGPNPVNKNFCNTTILQLRIPFSILPP